VGDTFDITGAAQYMRLGYEVTKELIDTGLIPAASFNQKHTAPLKSDVDNLLRETARRQVAERHAGAPNRQIAPQRARGAGAATRCRSCLMRDSGESRQAASLGQGELRRRRAVALHSAQKGAPMASKRRFNF